MLRTFVIWWHNKRILILLIFLCFLQWVIIICIAVKSPAAVWDPAKRTCSPMALIDELIETLYSYTIAFDLVILGYTIWGLRTIGNSPLRTMLNTQGIWYFVVTSMMSIVNMVFARLRLNYVMATMFALPSATASVMISSRAVIVLQSMKDFAGTEPERTGTGHSGADLWWRMVWNQPTECGELTTEDRILTMGPARDSSEVHPHWDRRWEDQTASEETQHAPDMRESRLQLVQTTGSSVTSLTRVRSVV